MIDISDKSIDVSKLRKVFLVVEKFVEVYVTKTDDLHKDLCAAHKYAYAMEDVKSVVSACDPQDKSITLG